MDFRQEIIKLLAQHTKLNTTKISLTIPPDPKLGDYAFPCFQINKNPMEVAVKLQKKIALPKFLSKISTAGPYLNFYLNHSFLAEQTLQEIKKTKQNYGQKKDRRSIVIEYCGPNTNKPLHLGHVRNMALGQAMQNLIQFQGNKVHPVNIVNDRGIHICQSLLAYQKWGNHKTPQSEKQKSDHFVGDFYVLFSKKAKNNDQLKQEAQQLLIKWEQNDPETRKLWKKMNQWVLDGFQETYHRFGIKFEKEYFESQTYQKGKDIIKKSKLFQKDEEGNLFIDLEKYHLPNKIVLRADGTSVYMTQDLYTADQRYQDFKFNKLIYVVASEQNLHFKQLFQILTLLKKTYAKNLHHLSYGLVHLPSGRMKSREGTVVDADDIMDEVAKLAEKEIKQRHRLSLKEIKKRSEFIALGAIKFFMLKIDPNKDMIFHPEDSLSFEGETGPYLQYTHARAASILRKAPKLKSKINFQLLNQEVELKLINLLYQFPEITQKAAQTYKPHYLANYLISLAQAFNEFYHQCPVISERNQQMQARLLLVQSTKQVLKNGLQLLGIHAPEEM